MGEFVILRVPDGAEAAEDDAAVDLSSGLGVAAIKCGMARISIKSTCARRHVWSMRMSSEAASLSYSHAVATFNAKPPVAGVLYFDNCLASGLGFFGFWGVVFGRVISEHV